MRKEPSLSELDVDGLRDLAIVLETIDVRKSLSLMRMAQKLRPQGPFISRKIAEYENEIRGFSMCDNGRVNIHIGVHKTATTHIQNHIFTDLQNNFDYLDYREFRLLRRFGGWHSVLRRMDWSRDVLWSDENLIQPVLEDDCPGKLYPKLAGRIRECLKSLKNRENVSVVASIRPMCDFLPSMYSQRLRHSESFFDYKTFSRGLNVSSLSWVDVFRDTLTENRDVQFRLFDFRLFRQRGSDLLSYLTFGTYTKLSKSVQTLSSFTNNQLRLLSGGDNCFPADDRKFSPYGQKTRNQSLARYERDIEELRSHGNVQFLGD